MGQGYIRNDTANNIADGNVADAADIDGEFDAIVAAFEEATGHTHDGTAAEGGAITVVGPAQDYVGAASDFSPKADSLYDLGKTAVRWATGYIDDLDITTNITVGGTVDGRDVATDGTKLDTVETNADVTDTANVTAAGALMDSELTSIASVKALNQGVATTDTPTFAGVVTSGNVDGRDVSVDGAKLDTIEANADVTDTANVTAAGALMDSEVDADIKTLSLPANTTISTYGASLVDDTTAAAALTTLGLTATAAELNFTDGVTSSIQTQIDLKAPLASPALTGTPTAPTATAGTNTTQVATTAFVQTEVSTAGGMVFIESQDASSSTTLDFTGFDSSLYDSYVFEFGNIIPATNRVSFRCRTSTDGGATYDATSGDYRDVRRQSTAGGSSGLTSSLTGTGMEICDDLGTVAGEDGFCGTLNLHMPHLARKTALTWQGFLFDDSSNYIHVIGGGSNIAQADVDAVRFYMSLGIIDSGTITMYGLRNS